MLGLAVFCLAAPGRTSEDASKNMDLALTATTGLDQLSAAQSSDSGFLLSLGFNAALRWAFFTAGVGVEGKTAVLRSVGDIHAFAGIAVPWSHARLEVLGILGQHYYPSWGTTLLSDDPGVTTTLNYVGARVQFYYDFFPNNKVGLLLGPYAEYDNDSERKRFDYTYTEQPWLNLDGSNQPYQVNGHQVVGASYFSLGMTVGVRIGLL